MLRAFGLCDAATGTAAPRPLPGGSGTCWRVGAVVLKPAGATYQAWLGEELSGVSQQGFRLPEVLRTGAGAWTAQGWGASRMLPGRPVLPGDVDVDWARVIEAGRALHRATAALPRPDLLDARDDWWATADRAAWQEVEVDPPPPWRMVVHTLTGLASAPRAGERSSPAGADLTQVVHGDLTGNVLLTDDGPPGIIDVSPYWRPASYAEGIVVADALCHHGALATTLHDLTVPVQAVARGLLFRVLTTVEMRRARPHLPHPAGHDPELQTYRRVADLLARS